MIQIVLLTALAAAILFQVVVWVNASSPSAPRRRPGIAEIANLRSALDRFEIDNGRFPTASEGIDVLVHRPTGMESWAGPYIEEIPADEWGHAYRYVYPVSDDLDKFNIISAGPDGIFGTKDDIDCWTR